MSVRAIMVIMLALISGTTAALGIRQLRGGGSADVKAQTARVVVANEDISMGATVSSDMVAARPWPKDLVPPNALSSVEECVDRASLGSITAGEPILEGKLASKEAGRGLAAIIPDGMRAYTIQTCRDASNVAGFILPGNFVDVLLTLTGGRNDETGGGSTVTLLQAVEVLAVAQRLDAPAENKVDPKELRCVTLKVTPDQAAVLDLGQNMGKLALSLRNPLDKAEATPAPATLKMLRFLQTGPVKQPEEEATDDAAVAEAVKPRRARESFQIRTIRGGHVGHVNVSSGR
jgi:pilus assembly protein CpaB